VFEVAEIPHRIPKEQYREEVPHVREALLAAQQQLLESAAAALIIVVGGADGAGKGDAVNLLNAWLDPRRIRTHGMGEPTDEEEQRPYLWRFWRRLPPKGEIAIFFGSWYTDPIRDHVFGRTTDGELDQSMERIRRFEQMLSEEGVIVLKLWFHLSKKQQKKRLKKLERNEVTRWQVTENDWKNFALYDRFRDVSTRALRLTSTEHAPWQVVSSEDTCFRNLSVGRSVLEALRRPLPQPAPAAVFSPLPPVDGQLLVRSLDLSRALGPDEYKRRLTDAQDRLTGLIHSRKFRRRSLLVVFEGADAAGKGGSIRRITTALDAREYYVVPIAAPSDEERARPYLWRFWRNAPRQGKVVIFDRSWYGRVLVERVEGFAAPADWQRAYSEINDFEEQLVDYGTVLVKLWLHIDKEEQLRRFQERENTSFKRHKITQEDWRNRNRWEDYELAVEEMVQRTSTELAPWTLVESNDKLFARVKALETVCDHLGRNL
jgi:polyphosphate:AMP phosphotransferase